MAFVADLKWRQHEQFDERNVFEMFDIRHGELQTFKNLHVKALTCRNLKICGKKL